eukprot:gene6142-biopygen6286
MAYPLAEGFGSTGTSGTARGAAEFTTFLCLLWRARSPQELTAAVASSAAATGLVRPPSAPATPTAAPPSAAARHYYPIAGDHMRSPNEISPQKLYPSSRVWMHADRSIIGK